MVDAGDKSDVVSSDKAEALLQEVKKMEEILDALKGTPDSEALHEQARVAFNGLDSSAPGYLAELTRVNNKYCPIAGLDLGQPQ